KDPFPGSKLCCRFGSNFVKRVLGGAVYIILNLSDERRDQIEVLVNIRELIEQLDHPKVVFQGMHSDTRQAVFPRYQVSIKGLMHVPQENEADIGHGLKENSTAKQRYTSAGSRKRKMLCSIQRICADS